MAAAPTLRLLHSLRRTSPTQGLHRYATLLAIGFTLFVLDEARRLGMRRIDFLSRDGYLPLQIARRLTGEEFDLRYLSVSRRALLGEGREDAARAYLAREGFLAPGPKLIVDIGWRGSTQEALARLSGNPVHGCYLGLLPEALRPGITPGTTSAYLFSFGHPAPVMAQVMDGFGLMELFFSAPHGPVESYIDAAPILAPHSVPEFAPIAQGILAEFDALDALLGGAWPRAIDPAAALHDLLPLLTTPSRPEVAAFNAIRFVNAPGGGADRNLITPIPWHGLLRAPRAALRRAADSPWRAGWVRAHLPWPPMTWTTFRNRSERLFPSPESP